jgi:hypothetical protein
MEIKISKHKDLLLGGRKNEGLNLDQNVKAGEARRNGILRLN